MPQPVIRARGAAALTLPLCLLALSACGGSRSSTTPPATTTAAPAAQTSSTASTTTPTSTTTTSTTATATTTTSATTTATTAQTGTCQPAQLRASAGSAGAAMQQYGQRIILTNTSSTSCTLYGYPGVALVDAGGQAVPTATHRGAGYTFSDPGPSLVHLASGASAWFSFGGVDVSQPQGAPCPPTTAVNVIPPNDLTAITVSVRAAACPGETIDVSAVAAGTGA